MRKPKPIVACLLGFLTVAVHSFAGDQKDDGGLQKGIDGGDSPTVQFVNQLVLNAVIATDKTENKVQAESGYAAARAAQQAALKKAREQQ